MVYPHEHILLRFNGHFGTTTTQADRWSSGIRFGFVNIAPVYDVGKLQTLVNAAQAAAITFHTTGAALTGTNSFLDYVSGAQIGVSGLYTPSTQQTINSPVTVTAGIGTPALPWNTALVTSLRTARPRGRASNGRVYWPCLAAPLVVTTGRMSSSAVDGRAAAFQTFLNALNTAASSYSTGMKAVVASAVGGGIIEPVTSIRLDDRLDSIERRENAQPSVWTVKAIS